MPVTANRTLRRCVVITTVVGVLAVVGAACSTGDTADGTAVDAARAQTTVESIAASTSSPAATAAPTTTPATTLAPASPITQAPITTQAPTTLAPTTTVAPFAMEELHAALGPAVQAWAAAPSGPTYDAVSAAARSVVESGRPIADVPGAAPGHTADLIAGLISYPGSDAQVVFMLSQLGAAVPAVTLAPAVTTPPPPLQLVDTGTDPRFDTCGDAKANGYGPYSRGDTEYGWYQDRDSDGVVCE